MNESILINNSVLRLPQLMRKRKREKDEEKALPLSFYGALSILWLCSAIRRCVSLSLLLSLPLCVSSVCVRARVSASLQFILGTPVVSVRHRAAWTHSGTAKRSARETEISSPPSSVFFFFLPLFPPLSTATPFIPTHTAQIYTHTYIYIYTKRNTQSRLCPLEANISFQRTLADLLALVCDLQSNSMLMNITNTTNTRGCLKDVYKVYVKNSFS